MSESKMNAYKWIAGRVVDSMLQGAQNPYITAELSILKTRRTKGARAALITGLIVGALIERGRADLAESVLDHIAAIEARGA